MDYLPALTQTTAAPNMSSRYVHVNTSDVISVMNDAGFAVYDQRVDKSAYREWSTLNDKVLNNQFEDYMDEGLTKANWWMYGGKILRHYSRDSLKVGE